MNVDLIGMTHGARTATSAGIITVGRPTVTRAGDLMIAVTLSQIDTSQIPAGWNKLDTSTSLLRVYEKVATASEPTVAGFRNLDNLPAEVHIFTLRGIGASTDVVGARVTNNTSSMSVPGITPLRDGLLVLIVQKDGTPNGARISPPVDMTEYYETPTGFNSPYGQSLSLSYAPASKGVASGTKVATGTAAWAEGLLISIGGAFPNQQMMRGFF